MLECLPGCLSRGSHLHVRYDEAARERLLGFIITKKCKVSFIPLVVLIVLISCCVAKNGNATLDVASQVTFVGWKIYRHVEA